MQRKSQAGGSLYARWRHPYLLCLTTSHGVPAAGEQSTGAQAQRAPYRGGAQQAECQAARRSRELPPRLRIRYGGHLEREDGGRGQEHEGGKEKQLMLIAKNLLEQISMMIETEIFVL